MIPDSRINDKSSILNRKSEIRYSLYHSKERFVQCNPKVGASGNRSRAGAFGTTSTVLLSDAANRS